MPKEDSPFAPLAPQSEIDNLPTAWDWRTKTPPVVTPVKNQGKPSIFIYECFLTLNSLLLFKVNVEAATPSPPRVTLRASGLLLATPWSPSRAVFPRSYFFFF